MEVVLEKPVVEQGRKIVIRLRRPATQIPPVISPCNDRTGKLYTGQGKKGYFETLTKEEKEDLPFIIDHHTKVTLRDRTVLDLDDDTDKAHWKWMQRHPYIAKSKLDCFASRDAVAFVEDAVQDAIDRIAKTEKTDEARYAVRQLSTEKRKRAAKIMGLVSADAMSDHELLDWLLNTATDLPEAVLQAVTTKNAERGNATIFFHELVKYKILDRGTDAFYRIQQEDGNGTALGHTVDNVVDWMLEGPNGEMVRILKARLEEVKKTGR